MNSYNKTVWINGQAPALSAENLNNIENGLEAVTNEVINSVQNVQLSGSTQYPNVNSAIENNVSYRVFAQGGGSPRGWLWFCGSKNYVDVEVSQIRMDREGKLYRRVGTANGGTVTWGSAWEAFEPGGGASNAVLEITEETFPASAQWYAGEIPDDFSGNGYILVLWKEELYYLSEITEYEQDPGVLHYYWNRLAYSFDLDGITQLISRKADASSVPTKTSDLTNDSGFLTQHQDISGKENTSNKVTSISASASNTQYPSALAVKNYVDSVLGDIETRLSEV